MAVLKYKSSDGTWKTIATKGGGDVIVETDPLFLASPAASITEAKKTEWDGKQDAITDLDAIRSGSEKGATALQGAYASDELDDVETNTYVKYVAQKLTEEQKAQARANIGAASKEELQRMYNELLALIQGGVITPSYAILDQAILDQAVLS
jgi:hypothetical protein